MLPDVQSPLTWALLGLLLGLISSEFLTRRGYGQARDTAISVVGAFTGGFLVSTLGLHGQGGLVASTAGAAADALLVTSLARALSRRSPA